MAWFADYFLNKTVWEVYGRFFSKAGKIYLLSGYFFSVYIHLRVKSLFPKYGTIKYLYFLTFAYVVTIYLLFRAKGFRVPAGSFDQYL